MKTSKDDRDENGILTATAIYIREKSRITELINKITAGIENDCDDIISWADVGSLRHVASQLQQVSDIVNSEGEYAAAGK